MLEFSLSGEKLNLKSSETFSHSCAIVIQEGKNSMPLYFGGCQEPQETTAQVVGRTGWAKLGKGCDGVFRRG